MFMYFDCAVRRHVSAKSDVPTYPPTCQSACPSMMLIYLLTAIGLSPGASTHLHTNNTQNNTNNNRTTQITNVEECGPCPVFASFTLAFALQLRRKHGKTSVRVRKISVRLIKTSVSVKNISVLCLTDEPVFDLESVLVSMLMLKKHMCGTCQWRRKPVGGTAIRSPEPPPPIILSEVTPRFS